MMPTSAGGTARASMRCALATTVRDTLQRDAPPFAAVQGILGGASPKQHLCCLLPDSGDHESLAVEALALARAYLPKRVTRWQYGRLLVRPAQQAEAGSPATHSPQSACPARRIQSHAGSHRCTPGCTTSSLPQDAGHRVYACRSPHSVKPCNENTTGDRHCAHPMPLTCERSRRCVTKFTRSTERLWERTG